ncbi:MAG: hypothetical protein Sylvanvirus22_1 [Sylvanvirus sp.]|uniref:Uncharacterized protein n=1 Tax=Sylvanvirus sp. TaxID=2487774 RepID=A0A3G5AIM4_9VIRU|nr:MAG: hypothetical protein Sylvanvirus22_1 [Sylvanvirus sp.]
MEKVKKLFIKMNINRQMQNLKKERTKVLGLE